MIHDLIEIEGYSGVLTEKSHQALKQLATGLSAKYDGLPVIIGACHSPMNVVYGFIFFSPKWKDGWYVRTTNVTKLTELSPNLGIVETLGGKYVIYS